MTDKNKERLFTIDTMARLLEHLAANEDAEVGNREIIYRTISKEIKSQVAWILKEQSYIL